MPRVHFVAKARKDNGVVSKGESYFWWKIKTGPISGMKCMSKARPRPSQLTLSSYYRAAYQIQESFEDQTFDSETDFEEAISGLVEQWNSLKDETQEKLDNMPEALRDVNTGETLTERIEAIEGIVTELEAITLPDIDPDLEDKDGEEDEIEAFRSAVESAMTETG